MIRLIKVDKQFASKKLFEGIDLHIKPNERVGLIGPNGSGKTTLLRIIRGLEPVDAGEVIVTKNKTIGFLEQDVTVTPAETVLEEIVRGFPEIAKLEGELISLEKQLEATPDDRSLLARYGRVRERFEHLEGYQLESKARAILSGVGFLPEQHKLPVRQFSGGWMMRIALARLLVQQPDILLMDEPTNHLDLNSIIWLENFLHEYAGTVVVISHDQYFLNRVINRVVEIEARKLVSFTGNYEAYQQEKAERLELLTAEYKNQQRQLAQTERFIERFRYKASKARQVQSRVKQLEKLDWAVLPENETPQLRFSLPQPERSGSTVAELTGVEKRYGEKLVYRNLSLVIRRRQKIALVGQNGAGKSTLLKILAGATEIQAGTCKPGHNVTSYYYAQHQLDILNAENTILEELAEAVPDQPEQWLRRLAGSFLFPGDDVFKKITVLSGGEKARVALAKMLANPANFLILDEPTNHLDMQARDILQQALAAFEGTMIFISHDRQFINTIASHIIEIENGVLHEYVGDYAYYLWKKEREREPAESEVQDSGTKPVADNGAGVIVNKKEERRFRALKRQEQNKRLKPLQAALQKSEATIAGLEAQKNSLTEELCLPEIIADKKAFPEKSKLLNRVIADLEKEYETWADLTEKIEQEAAKLESG